MCECRLSAEEFIRSSFAPKVAVLCSQDADTICWKNNLSFTELLQPFCQISSEVQMKDVASQSYILKNFQIDVLDMMEEPPAFQVGKKILSDAVGNSIKNANKLLDINQFPISVVTPWFESWRETMVKILPLSNHEFLNHFVAIIYVVSTNNEDPLQEFNKLSQYQYKSQFQNSGQYPKWFSRDILKHHVLIHDASTSSARNEEVYQHLITTYGSHTCHFLSINSRSVNENPLIKDFWSPHILRLQTNMQDTSQEDVVDPGLDSQMAANYNSLPNTVVTEIPIHHTDSQVSLYNMELATMASDGSDIDTSYLTMDSQMFPPQNLGPLHPLNDTMCPGSPPGKQGTAQLGHCLTPSDTDRLQTFVYEFVVRSLVPFMEKQIRQLNDMVAQRKGLHRSLFSATKRMFSSGKPSHSLSSNSQYVVDAPELQVRRLADLTFMFQNYELAYQCYHLARKDFGNDQAWAHFAGASEMAAFSIFMLGSQSQRSLPLHYFDDAVKTYLGYAKLPMYAVRSVLFVTEATKALKKYHDAALHFVRLTAEDSDLRSALFLEQAAYCYLLCDPSSIRKYAFHTVLAGNRYSKAFQRKLSLRCYQQAVQVYQSTKLTMASDHIQYSIGRQSRLLGHLRDAYLAYQELMTYDSAQACLQQFFYIKEFIDIIKMLQQQDPEYFNGTLPVVPVPFIVENSVKTMLSLPPCPPPSGYSPANHMTAIEDREAIQRLEKLEELLFGITKQPTILFKPTNHILTSRTVNKIRPVAYVGEPIYVEMELENPYKVSVLLENINLMWSFTPSGENSEVLSNDSEKKFLELNPFIVAYPYNHLNMEPFSFHKILVGLIPKCTGSLDIQGLGFYLSCSVPKSADSSGEEESSTVLLSKQIFKVRGPRLNKTKVEKLNIMYGEDFRLQPIIQPSMPCLQAFFDMPSQTYFSGEVKQIRVQLTNCGQVGLTNLNVAFSDPKLICFGSSKDSKRTGSENSVYMTECPSRSRLSLRVEEPCEECSRVARVPLPESCGGEIKPGQSVMLSLWVHAPLEQGLKTVEMLFYYESSEKSQEKKKTYRVLRHCMQMNVLESIAIKATSWRSFPIIKDGENLEEYNVVMELENVAQKSEEYKPYFQLLQVSGLSSKLQVTSEYPIKTVSLQINQKSTYSFKAQELAGSRESDGIRIFSGIACGKSFITSSEAPCRLFCERHTWNIPDLLDQGDKLNPSNNNHGDNQAIVPAKEAISFDVTIIVLWEGLLQLRNSSYTIYGQHHIHLNEINQVYYSSPSVVSPSRIFTFGSFAKTVENKTDQLFKELVKFTMDHQVRIEHNFFENRICIVPVLLTLHNCSGIPVLSIVDAGVPSCPVRSNTGDDEVLQPFQKFLWVSRNSIQVMVQPKETKTLTLNAALTHPGTYNLGLIQVSCNIPGLMKEKEFVLQNQESESVILVNCVTNR